MDLGRLKISRGKILLPLSSGVFAVALPLHSVGAFAIRRVVCLRQNLDFHRESRDSESQDFPEPQTGHRAIAKISGFGLLPRGRAVPRTRLSSARFVRAFAVLFILVPLTKSRLSP